MVQNESYEPVSDLPPRLAAPARRALAAAGYTRLEQLTAVSEAELLQLHGMGSQALAQLRQALGDKGLTFAGRDPTQVEQLVARFAEVNDALIAAVAGCTEVQWRRQCTDDDRPVGVVAHHVAVVNGAFARMVARLAAGESYTPNSSMDAVHQSNAQHAHNHATVGREETLDALRTHGDAIMEQLRSLGEAQLEQVAGVFGGHQLTVAQVVELVVIGHTAEHLVSISATLDRI